MGSLNIYNTSVGSKASLTFTGSSDVTVDSNNLSGLTSNVQTQLGQMIGVGQTWQDVTASRTLGTTYTNTTGKPIMVTAGVYWYNSTGQLSAQGYVNDVLIGMNSFYASGTGINHEARITFIVPNGSTYKVTRDTNGTLVRFFELR